MGLELFKINNDKKVILEINGEQLFIDATIDMGFSFKGKLTDHKVEEGSRPSDHKVIDPSEIKLTGVISNLPTTDRILGTAGDLFLDIINGNPIDFFSDILNAGSPSEIAYEQIKKGLQNSDPIKLITDYETFENLQITGLDVPFRSDLGGSLEFTLSLKEFITVSSETAFLSISALGKILGGALGAVVQGRIPGIDGVLKGGIEAVNDFAGQQVENLQGAIPNFPNYTGK